MDKLIVVHHATDKTDGSLSPNGLAEIKSLAEKLRPHVAGRTVIITSTAHKAVNSASLLAGPLNITDTRERYQFWADNQHPVDLGRAHAQVMALESFDTVLVVTHVGYVRTYPAHFAHKVLGLQLGRFDLTTGEAVVIDCKTKQHTEVRQQT